MPGNRRTLYRLNQQRRMDLVHLQPTNTFRSIQHTKIVQKIRVALSELRGRGEEEKLTPFDQLRVG